VAVNTSFATPALKRRMAGELERTVDTQVLSLAAGGVKLVVLDFDQTVLRIHSFSEGISEEEVALRDLEADFANLEFFQALVIAAKQRNITIAVASFGVFEVIRAYLSRACGPDVWNRENICTPGAVGSRDGCALIDGKNTQIETLRTTFGVQHPKEVVFVDDDASNVKRARAAGYEYSFHAPNALTPDLWFEICRMVGEGQVLKEGIHSTTSAEPLPKPQQRKRRSLGGSRAGKSCAVS